MSKKRISFTRESNIRDYRPIFIIATEGKETEPQYFNLRIFKPPKVSVQIKTLKTKKNSSPMSVLKRMEKYIKDEGLKNGDEAWLVVDKDSWKDEHLEQLYQWSIKSPLNRGLAVSNPQFEYWLLLHFENGNDIYSGEECFDRIKNHCQNYRKNHVPVEKFTLDSVRHAIKRAQKKDNPRCIKWPVTIGTTVYRMVERII